jgi:hypothetical protein
MIVSRIWIPVVILLLTFSGRWSAAAAELEIKKFVVPASAIKEFPRSHAAKTGWPVSHHLIKLSMRGDVQIPACCVGSMGLVLGVGY